MHIMRSTMCIYHKVSKPSNTLRDLLTNQIIIYFLMIILGIATGLSNITWLQDFGIMISDIFIKIFKFVSLPIIALSLIVTLTQYKSQELDRSIWRSTLSYTIMTTLIAASIACFLYIILVSGKIVSSVPSKLVSTDLESITKTKLSYFQHLVALIPNNIFAPFLEHQVMSVLLVGIVMGIAIRYIPEEKARNTVTEFFQGIHGIFITITKWIVTIIPLGLYGFITTTIVQLKAGVYVEGLDRYLLVVLLSNLIQGFVVLPLWLKSKGQAPFTLMKKMLPALSVAFFSKSSAGTLPVTIETAEKQGGISKKVSRVVLPLCTSINMNGCAAFIFTTVVYVMQVNGIELSLLNMLAWIAIATIAAVGNAGVPMGCFFLSASLLASMDVPISLLGIILPFYTVIDMVETALNVWSDISVAAMVDDKHQKSAVL